MNDKILTALRKAKEAQHGKYGYGAKEAKELHKLLTPDVVAKLMPKAKTDKTAGADGWGDVLQSSGHYPYAM